MSYYRRKWELYHNACLLKWSHIHHINGNHNDNRYENLEALINSKHIKKHRIGNSRYIEYNFCFRCKNRFTKNNIWCPNGCGIKLRTKTRFKTIL